MRILAIETSCDETALALLEASGTLRGLPKFKILKEIVASQTKLHAHWGGVVPNLAKREHQKNLPILLNGIVNNELRIKRKGKGLIHNSKFIVQNIDLIAVTVGPGLEPALWTGINFAEELAKKYAKPLIGVNHLEGHLYSFLLPQKGKLQIVNRKSLFPAVALIVSGGHTVLLKMDSLQSWKKLGETRDDAAGEAFDKVARMLRLPYPGGPEVEKLALRQARSKHPRGTIQFPRPMLNQKNYDFSFSGLKTAVLYHLRDLSQTARIAPRVKADIAASFTQAAVDVLVHKTMRAAREHGARTVLLSGGVAANKHLRTALHKSARKAGVYFLVPQAKYNTDNAAMIGAAAYINRLRGKKYKLEARGDLGI